jgi:hypothetical protein
VDHDFADDEAEADGEEDDDFPAGETGDVAAEEKEEKADCCEDAGDAEAADFQLDVDADDAAEKKEGGERGEPEGERLEAGRLDIEDGAVEGGFCEEIRDGIGDAGCEDGFTVDNLGGFLGGEGEQGALGVDDFVANFYFGVLRDEGLGDIGVVSAALRK